MRFLLSIFFSTACLFTNALYAQNYGLQIYGAIVTLNGGTAGTPLYLNVAQTNALAVTRDATAKGHIISEGQYNYLNIQTGAGTGSYLFPFGTGVDQTAGELNEYVPVTFSKTAGTSNIYISTRGNSSVATTNTDNTPLFTGVANMGSVWGGTATANTIDRWWEINAPGGATADVTFSYQGSENTLSAPTATVKPQRWDGSTWQTPVGSGAAGVTAGIGTVSTGSISTFSPWVISSAATPLPVELLDFSAVCRDGKVTLSWTTATEVNNDYFTVERSSDGLSFAPIAEVKGAGNSSTYKKYSSLDMNAGLGNGYYRLKQTDYDGKFEYFKTLAVNCTDVNNGSGGISADGGGSTRFSVYPNPSDGREVYVSMNGFSSDESILVVLLDMLGQVVYTKVSITDASGTAIEAVDNLNNVAAGVYTVIGSVRDEIYKQKLIIR